jgi:MFS family permease
VAAASSLAVAAAYALMGSAPSLAAACAGAVLGGVGNGMQWVAVASLAQRRAPDALTSRVAGALESVAALAPGAGFLLGGVAASLLDPRTCLLAGAGAIVVAVAAGAAATALPAPPIDVHGGSP